MINKYQNIYFIGIGGIGMSALARFFHHNGFLVAGYDAVSSTITTELQQIGINIHFSDDINLVDDSFKTEKDNTLIIYTPAIPQNHSELNWFKKNNFDIQKRAEVLGNLSKNKKTLAIAGTHGKTTITSITSHIFNIAGKLSAAFVGGILKNYKSNFIFDDQNSHGWLIVEADEFDHSFLQLTPFISIISAIDADHLDIYKNKENITKAFEKFVEQTQNILIINENVKINTKNKPYVFTYGFSDSSHFRACNIKIQDGKQVFDIIYPDGILKNTSINMPGKINIENSLAAFASAFFLGIEPKLIQCGLSCFEGVERRFDLILNNNNHIFINDYAHHPHEIESLADAIKDFFPNKKTTAVFQPHLFSRTKDFADDFAKALSKFDQIIITDIYPAREKPIKGVTSKIIFDKINSKNKIYCSYNNIIKQIKQIEPELLLTIGAGDINNLVDEIKQTLLQ